MAEHNQVRIVGYLTQDPLIFGEEHAWSVFFNVRTIHRYTEDYYEHRRWEEILVFCDDNTDTAFMNKLRSLIQYDLVDIKGVFNVMRMNKPSICPNCGVQNIKYGGSCTAVYPIFLNKMGNLAGDAAYSDMLPTEVLERHFREVSNQVMILGTVVTDPRRAGTEDRPICQYELGIDRKYYIRTQGEITSDYPWVYSFGEQALLDLAHLHKGSLVFVDAFLRNREFKNHIICENCQLEYEFSDLAMEFVPYSVEYLKDYYTDLDIARMQQEKQQKEALAAHAAIMNQ